MKNFLIFLVSSSTLLYQVSGAPEHFLVEVEDGHEEPRMDEDFHWSGNSDNDDHDGEDYQLYPDDDDQDQDYNLDDDLGILISGGVGDGAYTSVEVFSPGYQCVLPSLPGKRVDHTMDNMTLCGGDYTSTSCITFSSGKWVTSHAMAERRSGHTSWNIKEEGKIILMGGGYDLNSNGGNTTETITEGEYDGVPGFSMKYNTWDACAIPDHISNSVIITGGTIIIGDVKTRRTVSRYSTSGHVQDLPSLNQGRDRHGCGYYRDDSGDQVFLVAGGKDDSFNRLNSAEKLTSTSSAWVMVNNLPRKMTGLRGVTLGGVLYMTGGDTDKIYQWTGQDWEEVGKMKKARVNHAVSTIRLDDIKDYCT